MVDKQKLTKPKVKRNYPVLSISASMGPRDLEHANKSPNSDMLQIGVETPEMD